MIMTLLAIVGPAFGGSFSLSFVSSEAPQEWSDLGAASGRRWVMEVSCSRGSCAGYSGLYSPTGVNEWVQGWRVSVVGRANEVIVRGDGLMCPEGGVTASLTFHRHDDGYDVAGCSAPFAARLWVGSREWVAQSRARAAANVLAATHLAVTGCTAFAYGCNDQKIGVVCHTREGGELVAWPENKTGDWRLRVSRGELLDFTIAECGEYDWLPGGCFQSDASDSRIPGGCREWDDIQALHQQ